MNQALSTLNPFAPKGEAQSAARRMIPFLVGLSAVLLVVLVAYVAVEASEPAMEKTDEAFLAANPELIVARRYTTGILETTEATFFAANPELIIARRYGSSVEEGTEIGFLAANPEIIVYQRYLAAAGQYPSGTILHRHFFRSQRHGLFLP
jgi:hypothetical protein